MRLFIAVNFDDPIKNSVRGVSERLRGHAARGGFTRAENLHLTLAFLGEVPPSKAGAAGRAMDEAAGPAFEIILSGIGSFRRRGGDIWWVGVSGGAPLAALHARLKHALSRAGFELENRAFSPHLTIGRDVVLEGGFDSDAFSKAVPDVSMTVRRMHLMKSERIGGILTYTPIHETALLP